MADIFDVSTRTAVAGAVAAASAALDRGQIAVIPTDTVYGVAGRPDVPGATQRIFEAKRRPRGLTLPVLAAGVADAEAVAAFDDRARALAARFWPGGVTLVLTRSEAALAWDLGDERGSVGVRVPDHPVARTLLERTGPLATTSANVSGRPTPSDCDGVRAALGEEVAVYLCTGTLTPVPSTVVDLTGPEPRILRAGAVPSSAILGTLR
jgi:L-threonylcarbamoyladenylate synthase